MQNHFLPILVQSEAHAMQICQPVAARRIMDLEDELLRQFRSAEKAKAAEAAAKRAAERAAELAKRAAQARHVQRAPHLFGVAEHNLMSTRAPSCTLSLDHCVHKAYNALANAACFSIAQYMSRNKKHMMILYIYTCIYEY